MNLKEHYKDHKPRLPKFCKCGDGFDISEDQTPKFKGMYCYTHCCQCCPDSKKTKCEMELVYGR